METENSSPLAFQSRLFNFLWSIVTIRWAAKGHHYWPHTANILWDNCSTHSWILLRKIWSNVLSTTVWASLEAACYFWDMARESRQKGKVLLNCSENIQYPACIFKLCKWFWSSSEEPSQKLFISPWLGFDSLTFAISWRYTVMHSKDSVFPTPLFHIGRPDFICRTLKNV